MSTIQFNGEFLLTVTSALLTAYFINKGSPMLPMTVKFLFMPLVIAYIVLRFINWFSMYMNLKGQGQINYVSDKAYGELNNMNYI